MNKEPKFEDCMEVPAELTINIPTPKFIDPPEIKIEEKKSQTNVLPIALDKETQQLIARDSQELQRITTMLHKGYAFPKCFNTPEKRMSSWNLATALMPGNPQRVLSKMYIVNDQIAIMTELALALARETGELEDFRLIVIDKDHKEISFENKNLNESVWGSVCWIKRKGKTANQYSFTIADADRAGVLGRSVPWKTYTQIMLRWRSVGMGLKLEFADALMGVKLADYDFNEMPEIKDVTPDPQESFKDRFDKLKNESNGRIL